MTNSVDPDHTAPLGAVWSESALIAQIFLSLYIYGSFSYHSEAFHLILFLCL